MLLVEPGQEPVAEPEAPRQGAPSRGSRFLTFHVPLQLLLLGGVLRIRQYAGAKSLWMDEALLAPSLLDHSAWQLVSEPLQHAQTAPLGWLLLERLSVVALGPSELALRLVPLLIGLCGLGLAWVLVRQLLTPVQAPVALALIALNPAMIRYSHELKPYSADVLAVLAVLTTLAWCVRGSSTRRADGVLPLSLVGALAVWFSTAALVFVPTAAATAYLHAVRRLGRGEAGRVFVALVPCLVSGGLSASLMLRQRNAVLVEFWQDAFPASPGDVPLWASGVFLELLRLPLGVSGTLLPALLLLVGAVRVVRHPQQGGWTVLVVLAGGAAAAAVHAYPMTGRLALWTVPLFACVMAASLPESGRRGLVAVVVGALLWVNGPLLYWTPVILRSTQEFEALEPVLRELAAAARPGDTVVVDRGAAPAFHYYQRRIEGLQAHATLSFAASEAPCDDAATLHRAGFGRTRTWLVMSHWSPRGLHRESPAEVPRRLGSARPLLEIERLRAEARLYAPDIAVSRVASADGRCLSLTPGSTFSW